MCLKHNIDLGEQESLLQLIDREFNEFSGQQRLIAARNHLFPGKISVTQYSRSTERRKGH